MDKFKHIEDLMDTQAKNIAIAVLLFKGYSYKEAEEIYKEFLKNCCQLKK